MKRTSPFPSPPLSPSQNKKEKLSVIPLMNKQLEHLECENNETLGELMKIYPTEFEGLTRTNFVNSQKFENYFESTTDESKWKASDLTPDTLCKDIKGLVPVYFVKFHHWFLTISRKMPVGQLKRKLKKFLRSMTYIATEIKNEEDNKEYDKGLDFSNTPISNFPFKLQHLETNHILEIWDDNSTLEEAKIQDDYAVLFDGNRLTATSPNLRIYYNDYQKIVFPRTHTWDQFHNIIQPLIGSDNYVIVKTSLGGEWNPIVKNLDLNKPLFPQIEPRDHLFVTKTHKLADTSSEGNHLLFLKNTTDKKTLFQLSVNPELPLSQLMKQLNQPTPPAIISPEYLYWENYDESETIHTQSFKCGAIPERTILCFPDSDPKLRVLVYTPAFEFQELEFTPSFAPTDPNFSIAHISTKYHQSWESVTWGELRNYYFLFLKTKHNFVPPEYSALSYRFSDRSQDSWASAKEKETLLYLSSYIRSKTLFVSLEVSFHIQECRNTVIPPFTIYCGMHLSLSRAIRNGTHNRYQVHRLCYKENDKFITIEKHLPVLSFLHKTLVPFSYIRVNGQEYLFPHFTSIQKTLDSFEINSNEFSIVDVSGDHVKWNTQTDGQLFPEEWVTIPNNAIERSYQKALKFGKYYNPPFSIDKVSQREFNLKFGLMVFRISLRSDSKKFHKVFECQHDGTQKRLYSKFFARKQKKDPNIDFCSLAKIIYDAHNAAVKKSMKDQRCHHLAKEYESDVSSFICHFSLVISNDTNDIQLGLKYRHLQSQYKEMPRLAQIRSEKHFDRLTQFYQRRYLRQKYVKECQQKKSLNPWEFEFHKDKDFVCVVFSSGVVVDSDSISVHSGDGHSITFSNMNEDPDVVSFGFTLSTKYSSEARVNKVNNGYSISYTIFYDNNNQTIRSSHIFANEKEATNIAHDYNFYFIKMISQDTADDYHYHYTLICDTITSSD